MPRLSKWLRRKFQKLSGRNVNAGPPTQVEYNNRLLEEVTQAQEYARARPSSAASFPRPEESSSSDSDPSTNEQPQQQSVRRNTEAKKPKSLQTQPGTSSPSGPSTFQNRLLRRIPVYSNLSVIPEERGSEESDTGGEADHEDTTPARRSRRRPVDPETRHRRELRRQARAAAECQGLDYGSCTTSDDEGGSEDCPEQEFHTALEEQDSSEGAETETSSSSED